MNNREKAQQEWELVLKEAIEEENEITERLKREGKWIGGLDTNSEEYKPVNEKLKRRLKEIQEKYR
ncbi:MAG: hypothetical protein LUE87_02465 [Lachnospiraceae bacterium]|nr:hypothetical protein [Lachnospiraceae bacterium]